MTTNLVGPVWVGPRFAISKLRPIRNFEIVKLDRLGLMRLLVPAFDQHGDQVAHVARPGEFSQLASLLELRLHALVERAWYIKGDLLVIRVAPFSVRGTTPLSLFLGRPVFLS